MIVFSSNLAKINRVCVISNFKSNLHKSSFLLESKNFKKPSSLETKKDLKLDKKNVRERLAKMALISLNEKTINHRPQITEKQPDEIVEKEKLDFTTSFSLQFSAQESENVKSKKYESPYKIVQKDDRSRDIDKKLEKYAQKLAKLMVKTENEESKTTKEIMDKMTASFDREKRKSDYHKYEIKVEMDQIEKNKNDLIKIMSENRKIYEDEYKNKKESLFFGKRQTKYKLDQNSPYLKSQKLADGNGLSIFTDITSSSKSHESPLWSMHYDQELKHAQEIPPLNGFDELIKLTKQGKLWKFPIDNEQDIDETDAQIPFHEHVFLDHYLEEFPQIEPIQNFMTLALNGLSQNSFLSIKEKKEIIDWYKNYFNDRMDIIKEALEAERLEASYRESFENK